MTTTEIPSDALPDVEIENAGPEPAGSPEIENADGGLPRNPTGRKRDDFEDFPRDRHKRPLIIRAERQPDGTWAVPTDAHGGLIKEMVPFTRSSTLGGAIEYQAGLARWKTAVALWGFARSRGGALGKKVRAIPGYETREQKDQLYEIIDQAMGIAEDTAAADWGTALHAVFERLALGLMSMDEVDEDDRGAALAFLAAISRFRVVSTETRVVCDEALTAGKYDYVVETTRPMPVIGRTGQVLDVLPAGTRIVVDAKTSGSADYFGEKFTVQLWTYAHGRFYDKETGQRTETGVNRRWALILWIARGGDEAVWHWVDLSVGDRLVQTARDVLEGRKIGKKAIWEANLDADVPADWVPPVALPASGLAAGPAERLRQLTEAGTAILAQLAGRDPEDVIAGNDPADAALIDYLATWTPEDVAAWREARSDTLPISAAGCATHGPHPMTVDCPRCAYEGAEAPLPPLPALATDEAGQLVDRPAAREYLAAHAGQTVGELVDVERTATVDQDRPTVAVERPMPSAGAPPISPTLGPDLQALERDRKIVRAIKDATTVAQLGRIYERLVELDLWPGKWQPLMSEARQDVESGRRMQRATAPSE
jgi:hypothetical protein